jgi:predicted DNA-binding protein
MAITFHAPKPQKKSKLKDGTVAANYALPAQIREPLAALSAKTGASKSEIVRAALREYLEKHGA